MKLYNLLTNGYKYNNFYELLFSNYLSNGTPEIYEYTGVAPYTFTSNGVNLLDWYIKGNTGGVGDKTANLFDKDNTTVYNAYFDNSGKWRASNDSRSIIIPVNGSTTYTLSVGEALAVFRLLETSNPTPEIGDTFTTITRGENISSFTFTTAANTQNIAFQGSASSVNEWIASMMLNAGSYVLPYEPYNMYKIPILCGDTTTNIYIDTPLDLSDIITMSDTNISIPTVRGSNTISVDTTVQPSEIYIKYIGGYE